MPVSLNTSFSVSPFSRLTPLKDASCAVVVICWMIWLYWATRLARAVCDTVSAIGGDERTAGRPSSRGAGDVDGVERRDGAVPILVMIWLAPSLVEVKVSLLALVIDAVRLTPAADKRLVELDPAT